MLAGCEGERGLLLIIESLMLAGCEGERGLLLIIESLMLAGCEGERGLPVNYWIFDVSWV